MNSKIKKLSFRMMSQDQVRRQSTVHVTSSQIYNKDGTIDQRGVMSSKLGPSGEVCTVCKQIRHQCLGHEGHIDLILPVINPGTKGPLRLLLQKYCENCDHLNSITSINSRRCTQCKNQTLQKYDYVKPYVLKNKVTSELVSAEQLEKLLARIRPEVVLRDWKLKLNPSDLLIKTLLVPSLTIRPVMHIKGTTFADDLSVKLMTILEVNNKIKSVMAPFTVRTGGVDKSYPRKLLEGGLQSLYELLAYHVFSYIDNRLANLPVATHRGGKKIKSLLERLESKTGYFRSNLGAKRTDYSSRCTISPNGEIQLTEIGLSLEYAKVMTTPETITTHNLEKYRKNILEHYDYPEVVKRETLINGARVIHKITDVNRQTIATTLQPGDVIYRNLITGDWAIANRQPTLHENGFTGHRVVVLKDNHSEGQTARINSMACPPYNADFDGDEMTMHHPHQPSAMREVQMSMSFASKIVDRKNNRPMIGIHRQKLAAAFKLSMCPFMVPKKQLLALVGSRALGHKIEQLTDSRELFKFYLPKGYCFLDSSSPDNIVEFKNGVLVRGVLNKSKVSKNSPFAEDLCYTLGALKYYEFIRDFVRFLERVEAYYGFTLSVSDYSSLFEEGYDEKVRRYFREEYCKGETDLVELARRVTMKHISYYLKNKELPLLTTAALFASSGAAGNLYHLAQITGLSGLRTVRGMSPEKYFPQCYRPYLSSFDGKLMSQGLIIGNYLEGLNHSELIADCVTARDGLVESNIKIREVGYTHRKLSYSLGDIVVDPESLLRDSKGNIVEYEFDGTGLNGWEYAPESINEGLLEYLKQLPEGELSGDRLKSFLELAGYQKPVILTVLNHCGQRGLTEASAIDFAEELLMPVGAPIGMVCAHAFGQKSSQMALDAKHAKDRKATGMKNLFRLLEKTASHPYMEIEGAKEVLDEIYERYSTKRLGDYLKMDIAESLDGLKLSLKNEQDRQLIAEQMNSVRTYHPQITRIVEQADGWTIEYPRVEYCKNRRICNKISEVVVKGVPLVRTWTRERDTRLELMGESKNPAMYRWAYKTLGRYNVKIIPNSPGYLDKTRGVEIARKYLYLELKRLVLQGLDIRDGYISLASDTICRSGITQALTRGGIIRQKPLLAKCAFENTKKVLYESAINGEVDTINSPISAIICGAPVKLGSGYFRVNY